MECMSDPMIFEGKVCRAWIVNEDTKPTNTFTFTLVCDINDERQNWRMLDNSSLSEMFSIKKPRESCQIGKYKP